MKKSLPKFRARSQQYVENFAEEIFTHPGKDQKTFFRRLIVYPDGHYRALFAPAYFPQNPPSKSQWSTLKKKMKRHNESVFIFKEYGDMIEGETHYFYLDFGFFSD